MFDSTWNSAAFEQFKAQVGILKNGDADKWVLYDTASGDVLPNVPAFSSLKEAEEARAAIYDGWVHTG